MDLRIWIMSTSVREYLKVGPHPTARDVVFFSRVRAVYSVQDTMANEVFVKILFIL